MQKLKIVIVLFVLSSMGSAYSSSNKVTRFGAVSSRDNTQSDTIFDNLSLEELEEEKKRREQLSIKWGDVHCFDSIFLQNVYNEIGSVSLESVAEDVLAGAGCMSGLKDFLSNRVYILGDHVGRRGKQDASEILHNQILCLGTAGVATSVLFLKYILDKNWPSDEYVDKKNITNEISNYNKTNNQKKAKHFSKNRNSFKLVPFDHYKLNVLQNGNFVKSSMNYGDVVINKNLQSGIVDLWRRTSGFGGGGLCMLGCLPLACAILSEKNSDWGEVNRLLFTMSIPVAFGCGAQAYTYKFANDFRALIKKSGCGELVNFGEEDQDSSRSGFFKKSWKFFAESSTRFISTIGCLFIGAASCMQFYKDFYRGEKVISGKNVYNSLVESLYGQAPRLAFIASALCFSEGGACFGRRSIKQLLEKKRRENLSRYDQRNNKKELDMIDGKIKKMREKGKSK
jgi:hypothetical protein